MMLAQGRKNETVKLVKGNRAMTFRPTVVNGERAAVVKVMDVRGGNASCHTLRLADARRLMNDRRADGWR